MNGLGGKVAVVTGGATGIGAAVARRLAHDGATVVVNYFASSQDAAAVVRDIQAAGGTAVAIEADISTETGIVALFDETMRRLARVDILVNSAGGFAMGPLSEMKAADLDALFALNIRGCLIATREAVKRMKGGGRIVNMSALGSVGLSQFVAYGATKAAINAITHGLALELGPQNITVNAVSPGATDTAMFDAMRPHAADVIAKTALGRLGTPEDIAAVVAFLVSADGGWVTGQVIGADGGLLF